MAAVAKRKHRAVPKRNLGGRPEKWRPENMSIIGQMAKVGMTRTEIAKALQVRRETIWAWEQRKPGLTNVLKCAEVSSIDRVEHTLYERAVGYSYQAEKLFTWKGEIIRGTATEHVPGDVAAMIFFLKNRASDRWKDRMEVQHSHLFNFVGMLPSEEEWIARYAPNEPVDIKSTMPVIEDKSDDGEANGQ